MAHELSTVHLTDRTRLAPSDAFTSHSVSKTSSSYGSMSQNLGARRTRERRRNRSRNRRPGSQITSYKKLLWVKHPFPDNYTDEKTFLDHLERGRRELYEFWPLVADSMVIVQQVCAVVVFVCCFSGVIQERVSSITVVGCGTVCTGLGWVLWDRWTGREDYAEGDGRDDGKVEDDNANVNVQLSPPPPEHGTGFGSLGSANDELKDPRFGLGLDLDLVATNRTGKKSSQSSSPHTPHLSSGSIKSNRSPLASTFSSTSSLPDLAGNRYGSLPRPTPVAPSSASPNKTTTISIPPSLPPPTTLPPPPPDTRTTTLLTTLKSALLIHTTLLALSPLLKSLTKSTASDSIWALSICLMALNIFFFDYSSHVPSSPTSAPSSDAIAATTGTAGVGAGASFPASLSTNAGLMASTVLASRLSDTLAVFSLTLFSIEVFGLFPVFRRVLHQRWWRGHVALTVLLVAGAGAGVAAVTAGEEEMGLVVVVVRWCGGALLGGACALGGMGVAAWWLIGLQQYKDEMSGPWDVARPVLRRRWD